MVGAIKKWLGIDSLERETLALAKAIVADRDRMNKLEEQVKQNALESQKSLTPEPKTPKIVAKPKTVTWKEFRTAAEANDPFLNDPFLKET